MSDKVYMAQWSYTCSNGDVETGIVDLAKTPEGAKARCENYSKCFVMSSGALRWTENMVGELKKYEATDGVYNYMIYCTPLFE